MGLFDGGIPAGVQMMLANMVKQAAPQIVEQIDQFAQIVRDCKVQLDRIERQNNDIIARLDARENDDGQRSAGRYETPRIDGPIVVDGNDDERNERPLNDG